MTTHTALRLVSNEVGRVHNVVVHFEAESVEHAERICAENGWDYDGELLEVIPAPELDGMCEAIQQERDEEWIK